MTNPLAATPDSSFVVRPSSPPYRCLAEQAIAFLEAGGAPRSAAELAAHLLGAATARVGPIMETLAGSLAADGRFRQDAAGNWGLATWRARDAAEPPLQEQEFVVVDVETTGGRGEQHRLIEVAAIRLRGGQLAGHYDSLVNPGAAIRQYVTDLTGITQEMVDAAPAAGRVLDELRAFAGEAALAGHNVACDLARLNYEAVWHGLAPFGNPALDTQELAMRLLPALRRPSLARVAQALDLPQPLRHRALADARLAAAVLGALLARVDPQTARALSELQAWLASPLAARQARVRRIRSVLPPDALRALPDEPGVYTFRDAAGRALYVGKAVSLRQRVMQHFTGSARAMRLNDGLLDRTAAVEHVVVDTELDALLEEARRIRALQPPYNVQVASRRGCPFVRFEPGMFPRAGAAAAVGDEPAEYFGPYRTTRDARYVIQTVRRVFQIRSCRRALPATRRAMREPCLRLGQHLCPAPCADLVTPQQYQTLVEFARLFVAAGKAAALAALDARLAALAAADEPEGWERRVLAECRARLARVRKEVRPIGGGLAGEDLVMAYPAREGGLVLFVVHNGRLTRRAHVPAHTVEPAAIEAVLSGGDARPPGEAAGSSESDILLRWIYRHHGERNLVPVLGSGSVAAAAAAALAAAEVGEEAARG
jgi:DNA polymerase-3 subunit epsilon